MSGLLSFTTYRRECSVFPSQYLKLVHNNLIQVLWGWTNSFVRGPKNMNVKNLEDLPCCDVSYVWQLCCKTQVGCRICKLALTCRILVYLPKPLVKWIFFLYLKQLAVLSTFVARMCSRERVHIKYKIARQCSPNLTAVCSLFLLLHLHQTRKQDLQNLIRKRDLCVKYLSNKFTVRAIPFFLLYLFKLVNPSVP